MQSSKSISKDFFKFDFIFRINSFKSFLVNSEETLMSFFDICCNGFSRTLIRSISCFCKKTFFFLSDCNFPLCQQKPSYSIPILYLARKISISTPVTLSLQMTSLDPNKYLNSERIRISCWEVPEPAQIGQLVPLFLLLLFITASHS